MKLQSPEYSRVHNLCKVSQVVQELPVKAFDTCAHLPSTHSMMPPVNKRMGECAPFFGNS